MENITIKVGLVISLPADEYSSRGVIVSCHSLGKGWFKATIVGNDRDVLIYHLKYNADKDTFEYKRLAAFDVEAIANALNK